MYNPPPHFTQSDVSGEASSVPKESSSVPESSGKFRSSVYITPVTLHCSVYVFY